MSKWRFVGAVAAIAIASGASAQTTSNAADGERARGFEGFKIGASVDNRHHEVKRDVASLAGKVDERSGGVGYRAFAGYDKTLGSVGLIGVEAGVGNGGKDVQAALAGGTSRTNPGWAWDASVRFGVMPTPSLLLYGRTGYGWIRARETITPISAGSPIVASRTQSGLMYGVGAELEVVHGFALRTEFNQTHFGKGFKAARLQLGGVIRF